MSAYSGGDPFDGKEPRSFDARIQGAEQGAEDSEWNPLTPKGSQGGDFIKIRKTRVGLALAISSLILLLVVGFLFVRFGSLLGNTSPSGEPLPHASGPQAGTTMAWADGSTLVFVSDPNGQKGFWITLFPITKYQYSLCAGSGFCLEIPEDDTTQIRSVETPTDFIQSQTDGSPDAGIIGPEIVGPDLIANHPEIPTSYCGWMKGRVPTDAELKAFGDGSVRGFGDGSVHAFGPEYGNAGNETSIQDDTVHSETGIQDDTVRGLFCIVDSPLPFPQFARTSPYYDTGVPMEDMTPKVLKTEQFCQTDQGFQTLDLELDEDESIAEVNGDGKTSCQVVNGNRVVCFGSPNTNPQIEVGFLCNGFEGLRCQPGSEFDGVSCSNNMHGASVIQGLDGWQMDSHGVLVPVNGVQPPGIQPAGVQPPGVQPAGIQLPNGGLAGPAMHNTIFINGVMVAEGFYSNTFPASGADPVCPDGTQQDPACVDAASGSVYDAYATPLAACPCVPITTVDGGGSSANPIAFACPAGYYFDLGLTACASLGAPQTACLNGYHFNSEKAACEADQPDGNYPGCPAGQFLNPLTGLCDVNSQMLSPSSVMMYETLQISLPDCSKGDNKEGGGGPAPYCNPITSVCP